MSSEEGRRHLELQRIEADRRYNQALTELDREIVRLSASADEPPQLTSLGTALAIFLQQITPFVETKERLLVAELTARLDALQSTVDVVRELQTQVRALVRATDMLRRRLEVAPASRNHEAFHGDPDSSDDFKYVAFEDTFRGSPEQIGDKLTAYVPLFRSTSGVVDLGCGRGEFLLALEGAGISARGVDINQEMVAICRERDLNVVHGDALSFLSRLEDNSIGGIFAAQVVEHFEPGYLVKVLDEASRKLKPGAPIVVETINPACWLAFFSSYIRDLTHVRPIHPETLQYLLTASGFERVEIRYAAPVPQSMKMMSVDVPLEVQRNADPVAALVRELAHASNCNAAILNNLMFSFFDYAAVAYAVGSA
ncbi:MAG TPA: class I SAM-dependent methyltransferase [Vicinamibacterales bacterium]|nr:class I SAM-dependent methyltransferase [Vicinamibacterales bacterium]